MHYDQYRAAGLPLGSGTVESAATTLVHLRLKVALREGGVRHDLIDAVFTLSHDDDLVRLVARVEALQGFLKSEDGTNLLAGYKRAANILRIEEKKDGRSYDGEPDPELLSVAEERTLFMDLAVGRELIACEQVERDLLHRQPLEA